MPFKSSEVYGTIIFAFLALNYALALFVLTPRTRRREVFLMLIVEIKNAYQQYYP